MNPFFWEAMTQTTLDGRLTLAYLNHIFETMKPLIDREEYRIYEVENYGKIYVTMREYDKHFYRKWGTWGISDRNLRAAKALGASKVVVICRKGWPDSPNKPVAWISDIDDWFARGRSRWWEGEHEMQLHLKPEEMERIPDE